MPGAWTSCSFLTGRQNTPLNLGPNVPVRLADKVHRSCKIGRQSTSLELGLVFMQDWQTKYTAAAAALGLLQKERNVINLCQTQERNVTNLCQTQERNVTNLCRQTQERNVINLCQTQERNVTNLCQRQERNMTNLCQTQEWNMTNLSNTRAERDKPVSKTRARRDKPVSNTSRRLSVRVHEDPVTALNNRKNTNFATK